MTELRIKLIKEIVCKKRKIKEVSEILGISRQSISKWKAKYIQDGEVGLYPKKPGPKGGEAWNKTEDWLEDEVVRLAKDNYFKGPVWISDEVSDLYDIQMISPRSIVS